MEIELEAKALLTENEYNHILANYSILKSITQINYYFETEDDYFKHNNSALRVRLKEDIYELTLKTRTKNGNIEHNYIFSESEFDELITNRIVPQAIVHIVPQDLVLSKMEIIETLRHSFRFDDHIVELDRTDYKYGIDYELEIESDSLKRANKSMSNLLHENDIPLRKSTPKIARLFKYKNEQK